jgi:hypothetical protein
VGPDGGPILHTLKPQPISLTRRGKDARGGSARSGLASSSQSSKFEVKAKSKRRTMYVWRSLSSCLGATLQQRIRTCSIPWAVPLDVPPTGTRGMPFLLIACFHAFRRHASNGRCLRSPHTQRWLSTLRPSRLTAADHRDLSGKHSYTLDRVDIRLAAANRFPADTRGFFYFVAGPPHAPIAGEVRFRVTRSADPAGFGNGHDLRLAGQPVPWRVPLVNILRSKRSLHGFRSALDRDGAVRPELVAGAHALETMRHAGSTVVHSLGQRFLYDLSAIALDLRVAAGHVMHSKLHIKMPADSRGAGRASPYTGAACPARISRSLTGPHRPRLVLFRGRHGRGARGTRDTRARDDRRGQAS